MQNNDVTGSWASGEPIPGTGVDIRSDALEEAAQFIDSYYGLGRREAEDIRKLKGATPPAKVQGAAPTERQDECHALHVWLDRKSVPRADAAGKVFSLVGRVMRLPGAPARSSGESSGTAEVGRRSL